MAEPPSELTDLLLQQRYADFIALVGQLGLLRVRAPDLDRRIKLLHAELKSQRHPPGPTVEWLLIQNLVDHNILDRKVQEHMH